MSVLQHPAPGFVTGDRYGARASTSANGYKTSPMHGGQDFYPRAGASRTVVAAADGVVVRSPYNKAAGTAVCVAHEQLRGIEATGYAHLALSLVTVGAHVVAGQPIGVAGSTGASTGVHLHFDVFADLSAFARVDPLPFISAGRTTEGRPVPLSTLEDDPMVIFMAGKDPGFGLLFVGGAVAKLNSKAEHDNLVRAGARVVWLEQTTLDGLVTDLRGQYWMGGKR